jgi:hypothetical protein
VAAVPLVVRLLLLLLLLGLPRVFQVLEQAPVLRSA